MGGNVSKHRGPAKDFTFVILLVGLLIMLVLIVDIFSPEFSILDLINGK